MSHQRTAEHVTLECPAYTDIRHDFQELLQSYNSFQGLHTRMSNDTRNALSSTTHPQDQTDGRSQTSLFPPFSL